MINMNHYFKIAIALCACLALTAAQFQHFGLDYSDFATDFSGSNYGSFSAAARDPRANTGPVVFPPSPPGDPGETSGVVIGASGYGFVPPGSSGKPYGR